MARRSRMAARRRELRLRQEDIADACGVKLRTVKRWESGHSNPYRRQHEAIARAYQWPVSRLDWLLARGGEPGEGDVDGPYPDPDVDGREFLSSGFALAATRAVPTRTPRLGAADVGRLRAAVGELYTLDDAYGGGAVYDRALLQLREVRRILDEGAYGPTVGRDLQVVAGGLTEMVGWLAYDAGDQQTARALFTEALMVADLAENDGLRVLVMASMALQASRYGSAREALHLAEAAQRAARPFATPRLLSLLLAREALAHARLQDATSCEHALVRAEQLLDDDQEAPDDWLAFWGPADLLAAMASAQLALGLAPQSVVTSRSALDHVNPGYVRNRATYLSVLAEALVTDGEVEEAATVASTALDMTDVSSGRVRDRLGVVRRQLEPHASQPAVEHYLARA